MSDSDRSDVTAPRDPVQLTVERHHLEAVLRVLAEGGYDVAGLVNDSYVLQARLARLVSRASRRHFAQGTGFARLHQRPTDDAIVAAFKEAHGQAGERLMDDARDRGFTGPIHTSLHVVLAMERDE